MDIAERLRTVAAKVEAKKDPSDYARELIDTYPKLLKMFEKGVDQIDNAFKNAKMQCKGLDRAGAGNTEAGTILAKTLTSLYKFQKQIGEVVEHIEETVEETGRKHEIPRKP